DVGLSLLCMGIFLLYYYIIPQRSTNTGQVITVADSTSAEFSLPDSTSGNSESDVQKGTDSSSTSEASTSNDKSFSGNRSIKGNHDGGRAATSNTNTSAISSDESSSAIASADKKVTELKQYSNDNVELSVSKVETGSSSDKVTYYVADIYVTNAEYLKAAFAAGSYGKNLRASVLNMAEQSDAILAISGDYYGNSDMSVVIRNGVLYRSDVTGVDICVLYTDGTMKTYSPEEFDADQVIADGAWQAWSFGPALLDGNGNIADTFNTTSFINGENPRCSIGYVEPGHYIFVVVDGRDEGYSKGVTLTQLAGIMSDLGCQTAYNLDGGKSAAMVYDGEYVNQPADGGRTISDIIYIGK
ncbi:MAG TPA: phosphodiester glycosidase family protein, partial [Lachnospiraceae bacterium]|nr:phosphodiester glycosidase family protein [Lachnospiraceae bacterium]